jgi:hypothetical protein
MTTPTSMTPATMFEMRWIALGRQRFLQYRFITPCVDASGAFCPGGEFTEWQTVPTIDVNEAAWEDVVASGGLANAP